MQSLQISTVLMISLLHICLSYPAERYYKDIDPVPLFRLSLPMEVDEPSYKIENLSDDKPQPSSKNKRTRPSADNSESCCPTVVEVIEPLGGKNRSGDLVELYQGDGVRQRFYEVSCAPSVADNHCRFLDRRHMAHSKCVQQYSYTYALVRDFGMFYDDSQNEGWRLDYIQVRSGCSCQVTPRRSPHNS